ASVHGAQSARHDHRRCNARHRSDHEHSGRAAHAPRERDPGRSDGRPAQSPGRAGTRRMSPTFFAASEAESRLLPGGTFRGPTPYVIAIMTFVMMIVAAAGLALANAAGVVGSAVEHKYILQLS